MPTLVFLALWCVTCIVGMKPLQVGEVLRLLCWTAHCEEGGQVGVGYIRRKTQCSSLELHPWLQLWTYRCKRTHIHKISRQKWAYIRLMIWYPWHNTCYSILSSLSPSKWNGSVADGVLVLQRVSLEIDEVIMFPLWHLLHTIDMRPSYSPHGPTP